MQCFHPLKPVIDFTPYQGEVSHNHRFSSLKKKLKYSAEAIEAELSVNGLSDHYRPIMVTLTYDPKKSRNGKVWSPSDIRDFFRRVKIWASRGYKKYKNVKVQRGSKVVSVRKAFPQSSLPLYYLWVMELQGNGNPHYHVVFYIPNSVYFPKVDKVGFWRFGMTQHDEARSGVGYIVKYASKCEGEGKKFPKGARIYGVGGLTNTMKDYINFRLAPKWVHHQLDNASDVSLRKSGSTWIVNKYFALFSPYRYDFKTNTITFVGLKMPLLLDDMNHLSKKPPNYVVDQSNYTYRFIKSVDSIRFYGYYDAIDRALAFCHSNC